MSADLECWSNEMVFQFLDAYGNEPSIWDPKHPKHKNRKESSEAWSRISEALGGQFCEYDLKRKKDSLMASYRTCCYKIKASIMNGARGKDIYKPSWFAFQKMCTFLKDPLQTIKTEELEVEDGPTFVDVSPNNHNSFFESESPPDTTGHVDNMEEAYTVLRNVARKRARDKDLCETYGELLVKKLQCLDERSRDIAMNRIDNYLFHIKMEPNLDHII